MTDKLSPEKKSLLVGRIGEAINAYERATTSKQQYKAGSELCRLVDRLSDGTDRGIQRGDKYYVAYCERDGEYRIPIKVVVVERIPKIGLPSGVVDSLVDRIFKSLQTPLYTPVQVQKMEDRLRAFTAKLKELKEGR